MQVGLKPLTFLHTAAAPSITLHLSDGIIVNINQFTVELIYSFYYLVIGISEFLKSFILNTRLYPN